MPKSLRGQEQLVEEKSAQRAVRGRRRRSDPPRAQGSERQELQKQVWSAERAMGVHEMRAPPPGQTMSEWV